MKKVDNRPKVGKSARQKDLPYVGNVLSDFRTFGLPVYITWIVFAACLVSCNDEHEHTGAVNEPLPSWIDGPLKQAIISYVKSVTDSNAKTFIPVKDRIATFDNDGTLWAERPYVQELFAFYQVKKMVEKDPALAKQQPFKAVVEKDKTYFSQGGDKALIQLVGVTHAGMTEDEFEADAKDFFGITTYPGLNVPLTKIIYQPQLELLDYLRANGFKIFICTGGTVEFVRSVSEQLYGVPKEQVIGSAFKYRFVDSTASIIREPSLLAFNDKEVKPSSIQLHIGKRPVFACGNEGGAGDIAMLKYSQGSKYPSFQMLINHDDAKREFEYQEADNASLNAAKQHGWHVVSMKNDWKKIFPNGNGNNNHAVKR